MQEKRGKMLLILNQKYETVYEQKQTRLENQHEV